MVSVDLHKSQNVTSDFNIKIKAIATKRSKDGYIIGYLLTLFDEEKSFIILPSLLEARQLLLYCYCFKSRTKLLQND